MFDILGRSKISNYSENSELYDTYIKNNSKVGFLKVDEKVAPDEDEPTDRAITPHLYENKRNWARRNGCRRHRRSLCILLVNNGVAKIFWMFYFNIKKAYLWS